MHTTFYKMQFGMKQIVKFPSYRTDTDESTMIYKNAKRSIKLLLNNKELLTHAH